MLKVGLVGYRGMVGSVLVNRMIEEDDFSKITPYFFSTSNHGGTSPINGYPVYDANDIDIMSKLDCIITTQGSEYTNAILPKLEQINYGGYFIDASSALRMRDDAVIILDPVNKLQIIESLQSGIRYFAGGNCSITLSLIGLSSLFKENLIEWMSMMTYQAASGAGAKHVRELLCQMDIISAQNGGLINDQTTPILKLIEMVNNTITSKKFPINHFHAPLAGNIIPWIDADLNNGSSKEEWKGEVEANKILGLSPGTVKIDGFNIRVSALRSHSMAITMKLTQNMQSKEVEDILVKNEWINYVPNNKECTIRYLTPVATYNSLKIAIGRLKKSSVGDSIFHVFAIGDQLLWGASEPLRRMLNLLIDWKKGVIQ